MRSVPRDARAGVSSGGSGEEVRAGAGATRVPRKPRSASPAPRSRSWSSLPLAQSWPLPTTTRQSSWAVSSMRASPVRLMPSSTIEQAQPALPSSDGLDPNSASVVESSVAAQPGHFEGHHAERASVLVLGIGEQSSPRVAPRKRRSRLSVVGIIWAWRGGRDGRHRSGQGRGARAREACSVPTGRMPRVAHPESALTEHGAGGARQRLP